jgi:hypothetical protein
VTWNCAEVDRASWHQRIALVATRGNFSRGLLLAAVRRSGIDLQRQITRTDNVFQHADRGCNNREKVAPTVSRHTKCDCQR